MPKPKFVGAPVCIFYGKIHDVDVVINVPVHENTRGRYHTAIRHLRAIPDKVKDIDSLDGLPALLKKIEMTGIKHVETVKVTYQQNEQKLVRNYTVDQFYKL